KKIARCTGPFKGYRNTKRVDAVYFLSDDRPATDENIVRDRNTGLLSRTTIGIIRCLFSLETPPPKHPALSSVDCLENWIFQRRHKTSEDIMLHLLAYVEILNTDNSGDAASPSQLARLTRRKTSRFKVIPITSIARIAHIIPIPQQLWESSRFSHHYILNNRVDLATW